MQKILDLMYAHFKCRGKGGCQSAKQGWKADDLGVKPCLAMVSCVNLGKELHSSFFKLEITHRKP